MSSFAEIFEKMNLENLPKGEEVSEKDYELQKEIDMLEGWLKLCERNASAKEKFLFAQKYGFLSETHFGMWLCANDAYRNKLDEFEELEDCEEVSAHHKAILSAEVKEAEEMARAMKNPSYYRFVMRRLGKKDFSPYGEDLLKGRLSSEDNSWTVDLEKTIEKGYISHKSSF